MHAIHIEKTYSLGEFVLEDTTFPYNSFIARLCNLCRSEGFEPGNILPSRAFCSDENQGYPIILIAKHFGAFPFNHGRVGGIVATDRHGPHAHHGKDLVIIHASHVGYDPELHTFGTYRRIHTERGEKTSSCGKIDSVVGWYVEQYAFAQNNIFLHRQGQDVLVTIDNHILNENKKEGIFLYLDKIVVGKNPGEFNPLKIYSTSKCYLASPEFCESLGAHAWPHGGRQPIGERLLPDLFYFKRHIAEDSETSGLLEENLIRPMAMIVSSPFPLLKAAQANTQVEFDRTYRTLLNFQGYQGKRVVFISGLNIDISPQENELFPLTTFVPWAAYIQDQRGRGVILEQGDISGRLRDQSQHHPEEVNLEAAIQKMKDAEGNTLKKLV